MAPLSRAVHLLGMGAFAVVYGLIRTVLLFFVVASFFTLDLGNANFAAAWQGVLGVSRTWRPAVGVDAASGVAWAGGYAGDGVAASNLAARTLRDLILGHDTELTTLPWVGPFERSWEPEPFRYAGIHAVHKLLGLADSRELRTGKPSVFARVAGAISGRGD